MKQRSMPKRHLGYEWSFRDGAVCVVRGVRCWMCTHDVTSGKIIAQVGNRAIVWEPSRAYRKASAFVADIARRAARAVVATETAA